jgi:8-oxo-dGTP pyrophosphatase MutT (NUDIX family)
MRQDDPQSPWKRISAKTVYDNPWIKVEEHAVLNPAGNPGIYGTVHLKNLAIGVVPLDTQGMTWLVRQYRFPLKEFSWEIPEGGGDPKINPLDSAKRELMEETGITAKQWTLLRRIHLSNSVSDEEGFVYLAEDLEFGLSSPEETEILQVKKFSIQEAWEMVCSGEITDSLTVIGLTEVRWGAAQKFFAA